MAKDTCSADMPTPSRRHLSALRAMFSGFSKCLYKTCDCDGGKLRIAAAAAVEPMPHSNARNSTLGLICVSKSSHSMSPTFPGRKPACSTRYSNLGLSLSLTLCPSIFGSRLTHSFAAAVVMPTPPSGMGPVRNCTTARTSSSASRARTPGKARTIAARSAGAHPNSSTRTSRFLAILRSGPSAALEAPSADPFASRSRARYVSASSFRCFATALGF
mmetsp:Transcript_12801/g.54216  ORF Transcript_12801/g.54216 Transcript_12801/m.54216 type:complete len:217 (-) Transcript_12801:447-1097(-)